MAEGVVALRGRGGTDGTFRRPPGFAGTKGTKPILAANQVSTLRGGACMNVAGCLLANEQLVKFRIARRAWRAVRRKAAGS